MVTTSVNLSPNSYTGRSEAVTLIGIHTMEAPEVGSTAESVASYFKNPSVEASAHWCVDDNSRVRCVNDSDGAWTMPPTNHYSLNIEMAGYAGQTSAQWDDPYSNAVLDIAALCAAEWCHKYAIPVRHLTDSQIAAKEKGLAGHVDVNRVFHESTHTDPGPNFPWGKFLSLVSKHMSAMGSPAEPAHRTKPNCTTLQRAVRTYADNQWGPDTDKHCTALIGASAYGGERFPYGIVFAQEVVGTAQDGIWGPNSKAALKNTTANVQRALAGMGFNPGIVDGIWGPNTNKAYSGARSACHI